MAAPLLAGLARIGAGLGRAAATGARSAARSGTKKLVKTKVKSFAKDKIKNKAKEKVKGKLSKKSKLLSFEGDQQEQKLKYSSVSGELTPTLTGTTDPVKIKSAPSSKSQVEQLKINVTNIHSFLVKSNKQYKKQEADTRRNETVQRSKIKLRGEERRLEKKSSPLAKSASIVKGAMQPAKSLFDRLMDFAGALLLGILVNALPAIIKKVKEIVDNIVNFLTPIQSGFNLVKGFFTGDLDESKYDADKKRFSDGMDNINEQIDKVSEKMGPLGEIIKVFKPVIDLLSTGAGGKKIVLAKKDGKEGVLNKETGEFTERQFTAGERKKYDGDDKKPEKKPDTVTEDKPDIPLEMKEGHYYFPLPKGQFSGQSGQYYGAGRGYGGHAGIDLTESPPFGQNPNIDVVAMVGGKVLSEKYLGGKEYMSGMMIQGTDGYDQRYLHMTPMVSPGDNVKAGQKIGELVDMTHVTGNIDETHLHFEVYKRGKGGHLSPHKVYPKFFGSPRSAPRSLDTREKAQGGRMFESIRNPKRFQSINQPMDDEETTTIAIQQVNTIQMAYVPMPIPMRSRSTGSTSSTLPPIWTS